MLSDQRIAELAKDVAAHLDDEYGLRNLVATFAEQSIRTAIRETQEACEQDAKRYRWLRTNQHNPRSLSDALAHEDADFIIDAAMKAGSAKS